MKISENPVSFVLNNLDQSIYFVQELVHLKKDKLNNPVSQNVSNAAVTTNSQNIKHEEIPFIYKQG